MHVSDVAEAHLAVLDGLPEASGKAVPNIGTGVGSSVPEMVDAIILVSGGTQSAHVAE